MPILSKKLHKQKQCPLPTWRGTLYCGFSFHACALYRNELFLRRFFIFLFPVFPADLDHQSGQGQQCDQVRDYHKAIEEVRKVPDQLHFLQRTEQHTEGNTDAVYRQRFLAEEGLEVDLAEEVPADDGGKGEEQHAHGDEGITEPAELLAEGQLGQSGTGGTASEDAGGEDHHSGEGEDHEGVNKDADHGDLALFLGVLYLSQGMGMRSGAHTGLIAEQTSCHTDAHCLLNADTSGAAHNCLCAESGSEDHAQGFGDSLMVDHQESGAADDVEERHNRDNLFGEGGDPADTAQEDEGSHRGGNQTHSQLGKTEGIMEGIADGVGLHHIAGKAQGKDNGDGEEASQELSELSLEDCTDIVDGAAGDLTVNGGTEGLGEDRFSIDGSHTEESGNPHPEDGACAAAGQSHCASGDVAGTHLSGDGSGQCLEGTHTLMIGLFTVETEPSEQTGQAMTEPAHLNEAHPHGEPDAGTEQEEQKDIVPEKVTDTFDQRGKLLHDR